MRRFQQHEIHHLFKELLAKVGCTQSVDFVFYLIPSAHVLDVLNFDVSDSVFLFSFNFYQKKEEYFYF